MNEQQLHERLERATDHVVGGPDLSAAIRAGRTRRRRTHGLAALGVAAVLAVGGIGLATVLGGGNPTAVDAAPAGPGASTSVPASPAGPAGPEDWVPGTDIDQQLAATVSAHLPSLGTPDDVYVSDSQTAGRIPDSSWPQAEDWQLLYTLQGHQTIVMTASPAEAFGCEDCTQTPVADGTLYRQTYDSDGLTWHGTWLLRPDGSAAVVLESVAQGAQSALPDGRVESLLSALTFPSGA